MGNERERSWGNVGASRARIEVEAGSLPVQKRPMPICLRRSLRVAFWNQNLHKEKVAICTAITKLELKFDRNKSCAEFLDISDQIWALPLF